MKDTLIGIYFVEGFKGSGMADYVLGPNNELYSILIFNSDAFGESLSDWMTFRESSCFEHANERYTVEIWCGEEYSGLMYALMHEASHIVDMTKKYTPYTEWSLAELQNLDGNIPTQFSRDVWESYDVPTEKYRTIHKDEITFYGFGGGPKIPIEESVELYIELAQMPFSSLYSQLSWAEDFAEIVTWFHLTTVLEQPYQIIVKENGEPVLTYSPMEEGLVQARASQLESLYSQ